MNARTHEERNGSFTVESSLESWNKKKRFLAETSFLGEQTRFKKKAKE